MTKRNRLPSHQNQDCHHRARQIVVAVMIAIPRHPPAPAARTQEEQQTTPTGGGTMPLSRAVEEVRPKIRWHPQQAHGQRQGEAQVPGWERYSGEEPNHPTPKM